MVQQIIIPSDPGVTIRYPRYKVTGLYPEYEFEVMGADRNDILNKIIDYIEVEFGLTSNFFMSESDMEAYQRAGDLGNYVFGGTNQRYLKALKSAINYIPLEIINS